MLSLFGDNTVRWPIESIKWILTWRRCLSCNGRYWGSLSSLPCEARSLIAALTKRCATSSDASISTRVAVRVLRIDTAAAATPARRLINATATRSWVRTGRSYQSFCSTQFSLQGESRSFAGV